MPNVAKRLYPNLPEELQQWTSVHDYIGQVTKVSDGDTIHVSIQLGFGVLIPEVRIRLLGIDAPELRGAEKFQAEHSRSQLHSLIHDKWVGIETHADQSCRYGRWLAVIWIPCDGKLTNVNRWMVDKNFAVPYKANRFFDASPDHMRPLYERCSKCSSYILPTPGRPRRRSTTKEPKKP